MSFNLGSMVTRVVESIRKPSTPQSPKDPGTQQPDAPPTDNGGGGERFPKADLPKEVQFKTVPPEQEIELPPGARLDGMKLAADPDDGGEVTALRGGARFEGLARSEDPDAGGEVSGFRSGEYKVEGLARTEDPDAGGEVTGFRGGESKVEGMGRFEDPDAGGEVTGEQAVRLDRTGGGGAGQAPPDDPDGGGPAPSETGVRLDRGAGLSADPEEGGEVVGGPQLEGMAGDGLRARASADPEEGGEYTDGHEPKMSGDGLRGRASSDPQEGGEILGGDRAPGGFADEFARKAGQTQPDYDMRDEGGPAGMAEALARKAGQTQPDYDMGDEGGPAGMAEALARKAGREQQEYLQVKLSDVLVTSREAPSGGRTEVQDAHDKYANMGTAKTVPDYGDDDEPSTLVSLEDHGGAVEMSGGLASAAEEIDVDLDLDMDLDGDADDLDVDP